MIIWRTYSLHLLITSGITTLLVHLKSTLSPFLYRWKIRNKTRVISARGTEKLAIGRYMNNMYLHYDYLVGSKSPRAKEIGVIKL